MKTNIKTTDITNIHRVEAKNPSPDRPPAVLVQFNDVNKRGVILKQRKILKNSGVIIREDLTHYRLALLKKAISKYSDKNVWSVHGNIYVKSENDVHRVNSEMDI